MSDLDYLNSVKKEIYYHNSILLRKRQKETIENTPRSIKYEFNKSNLSNKVKDTEIFKIHKFSFKFKIIKMLKRLIPLLNIQRTGGLSLEGKLSYTWGKFILNQRYSYIVELDTPYVLTYYNVYFFRLLKPIIRFILNRNNCKQIVCISEASKNCLINELGTEIGHKVSVVYPWIAKQTSYTNNSEPTTTNSIKLLFISTQFTLKGGRELLIAFSKLKRKYSDLTLTLISNLSIEAIAKLPEGVSYLAANIDKDELNQKIYPTHDVFVLPSYQDSFGLVYLEALSHSLPIVSTDRFAMPEMIKNDVNGVTITPPFKYYLDDCRANEKYWGLDLAFYTGQMDIDYDYVNKLESAIDSCILNSSRYSKSSNDLFEKVFSPNVRAGSFKEMLRRCRFD